MEADYDVLSSYLEEDERLIPADAYSRFHYLYDKIVADVVIVYHLEWPYRMDFVKQSVYHRNSDAYKKLGDALIVRLKPPWHTDPRGVFIDRLEYYQDEANSKIYNILGIYARIEYENSPGSVRYIDSHDYLQKIAYNVPGVNLLGISFLCSKRLNIQGDKDETE